MEDGFTRNAKYRGIPFAKIGMLVEMEEGLTLNCHPNWSIKYFDDQGQLLKEFGR